MKRFALPVTELLMVAVLTGVLVICWLGYQVIAPSSGPQTYQFSGFHVVGDKMYDGDVHVGDWVPPKDGKPGHWKTVTIHPAN